MKSAWTAPTSTYWQNQMDFKLDSGNWMFNNMEIKPWIYWPFKAPFCHFCALHNVISQQIYVIMFYWWIQHIIINLNKYFNQLTAYTYIKITKYCSIYRVDEVVNNKKVCSFVTCTLYLSGERLGLLRSSISEPLEPEDETLIWSAKVFFGMFSLPDSNLQWAEEKHASQKNKLAKCLFFF